MKRSVESVVRSRVSALVLLALIVGVTGCRTSTSEAPAVSGRRVQNAEVVVHGAVPIQLSAYEQDPTTYVAGGWARQKQVDGELVTVFELALEHFRVRGARRAANDTRTAMPLGVRVVVHEGSGDVALIARR
jgi:hypothetical protein